MKGGAKLKIELKDCAIIASHKAIERTCKEFNFIGGKSDKSIENSIAEFMKKYHLVFDDELRKVIENQFNDYFSNK